MKVALLLLLCAVSWNISAAEKHPVFGLTLNDTHGKPQSLDQYRGKVILVVNVASKCGFTKQYKGLQALYTKYKFQGLVILGFPCNDFGRQEPGSSKDIEAFCNENYGVTFPLYEKIEMTGIDASPLYKHLINQTSDKGPVKWNFEKFLIDKKGNVTARYRSKVKPNDPGLNNLLKTLLAQ